MLFCSQVVQVERQLACRFDQAEAHHKADPIANAGYIGVVGLVGVGSLQRIDVALHRLPLGFAQLRLDLQVRLGRLAVLFLVLPALDVVLEQTRTAGQARKKEGQNPPFFYKA